MGPPVDFRFERRSGANREVGRRRRRRHLIGGAVGRFNGRSRVNGARAIRAARERESGWARAHEPTRLAKIHWLPPAAHLLLCAILIVLAVD